jgi:hypothetical protein
LYGSILLKTGESYVKIAAEVPTAALTVTALCTCTSVFVNGAWHHTLVLVYHELVAQLVADIAIVTDKFCTPKLTPCRVIEAPPVEAELTLDAVTAGLSYENTFN